MSSALNRDRGLLDTGNQDQAAFHTLDQDRAPFLEGLVRYAREKVIPFHTPGHKLGRCLDPDLRAALGTAPFTLDLSDEISDPCWEHNAEAVLREAESLAAAAFGADRTFFLCNGTTAGIQAMLMASCWYESSQKENGEVILPRSVHRSVISGLILAGLRPVFVPEEWDREWEIPLPPPAAAWEKAVMEAKKLQALFTTYPSYYGLAGKLEEIVRLAHKRDKLCLVDEAHGAHFSFHPDLPPAALALGADAAAQSAHKILGVLTQASLLHSGNKRLSHILPGVLNILLSTSPSFLLYASLDAGRRQMVKEGRRLWQNALELAHSARKAINRIPGLSCLGEEIFSYPQVGYWDPTKLLISVRGLGISGGQAERWLRSKGIQVELAGPTHILALITIGDGEEEIRILERTLATMAETYRGSRPRHRPGLFMPAPAGPMRLTPRQAVFSSRQAVRWDKAVGAIAAESLTPYPPGIPLWIPGEEITYEAIELVRYCCRCGIELRGWADVMKQTIWVVGS